MVGLPPLASPPLGRFPGGDQPASRPGSRSSPENMGKRVRASPNRPRAKETSLTQRAHHKAAKPRVLCVDDEPFVLDGIATNLRRSYDVTTATDPEEALRLLASNVSDPFAVILSDMRMPGMSGAAFLERARHITPESVRLLLTGYADIGDTIKAVNDGKIYQYISKPCPAKALVGIFSEAMVEFRTREAETAIIKGTLRGSVRVLMQILANVNPTAFGCTARVQRMVKQIVKGQLSSPWQFELAASLSQLGCISLPIDTLNKITAGKALDATEEGLFTGHPTVAKNFLQQIPRLEEVSAMVAGQQRPVQFADPELDLGQQDRVQVGAQLLRVTIDFDQALTGGLSREEVMAELRAAPEQYYPPIVNLLDAVDLEQMTTLARYINARELATGMLLDEDLVSRDGVVLASKGGEVTYEIQKRLRRFAKSGALVQPFRVLTRH